jgi:GH18 family chitinase
MRLETWLIGPEQTVSVCEDFYLSILSLIMCPLLTCVDLDWEYPGGNGEDYPKVPNSQHAHEIAAFPKVVRAIREAIGDDKILSLATPARRVDMIAYTKRNVKSIAQNVNFINVSIFTIGRFKS